MKTRIVSPHEWRSFFRDFSRIHSGALITINVSGPGVGSHDEVVDQPFRGISEDGDEIFVHVGDGSEHPHLERRVERVDAIRVQQTDEGADAAVEIASIDGTRTMVRFRSPALPELLDPAVE
jgi:hypothetical protein